MFKHSLFPVTFLILTSSLVQASDSALEEVVVSASRTETPIRQVGTSVSVISAEAMQQMGFPSLAEILRTQVGISATNSGGPGKPTTVRIRGEEGYRTLFMIDGVEMSDPTGTQVGTQVQNLVSGGEFSRVEILRGPQGFAYGADAGGVVNLFTHEAENGVSGQLRSEAGKFDTQNHSGYFAAGGENASLFFAGALQDTGGINARADDNSEDRDGYQNRSLHGKIRAKLNAVDLRLVVRDVLSENQFDSCGFPRSDDCFGEFAQTTARASGRFEHPTNSYAHELGIARTEVKRENFASGVQSFGTEGAIDKIDFVNQYSFNQAFALVSGIDFKEEQVNAASGSKLQRSQLGVFSEAQLNVSDTVYLSAGARYDDNEDFGEHVSLRVSSAYIASLGEQTLKLRSSFGNGFRAPSLSEIAYNRSDAAFGAAAETQLTEEKSRGADVGFDFYLANGASLEASYFYQEITDEIFFDLVNFSGYLQSEGDITSKGLELAVQIPLASFIDITSNITFNKTEDSDGLQRIRRPERLANLGINFKLLGEKLILRTQYRDVRGSENELFGRGRAKLDDYELIDISASYNLYKQLHIFARVDNLLNEDYKEINFYDSETDEITGFNTAGIAAYGGARLSF